jgi:hypothetical protein
LRTNEIQSRLEIDHLKSELQDDQLKIQQLDSELSDLKYKQSSKDTHSLDVNFRQLSFPSIAWVFFSLESP